MIQFRPSPDALLTELKDGTGVLLHLRTRFYFGLNQTGLVAWKLIATGQVTGVEALAVELAARFQGTSEETARADLSAMVRELEEEGLLLPADPGGGR